MRNNMQTRSWKNDRFDIQAILLDRSDSRFSQSIAICINISNKWPAEEEEFKRDRGRDRWECWKARLTLDGLRDELKLLWCNLEISVFQILWIIWRWMENMTALFNFIIIVVFLNQFARLRGFCSARHCHNFCKRSPLFISRDCRVFEARMN